MTRDEIVAKWETLTPRERDAWVAEVVCGLYVAYDESTGEPYVMDFGFGREMDSYTTDISAAWAVLEYMNADHYVKIERISERVNVTGNYVAECGEHIGWGTAPEAICLAALIARLTKE